LPGHDPQHDIELAGEHYHQAHPSEYASGSGRGFELNLAAELGLLEGLQVLTAHFEAKERATGQQRITLSRNGMPGVPVGNPAEWALGYLAKSVALWNPNGFAVFLGANGPGAGTLERGISIPSNRLVVLPIEGDLLSIGTAAANIAATDATVWAWAFHELLAPAVYQF
jgi:hypothetical protein